MSNKMKVGELRIEIEQEEHLWYDRKRVTIFALPWSFSGFCLTPTKLIVEKGFFNRTEEEIKLYRIIDVIYSQSLFERIGKTGTIKILSNDTSSPELTISHVKNARIIKDVISKSVEEARHLSGVRTSEMVGQIHHDDDCPICD